MCYSSIHIQRVAVADAGRAAFRFPRLDSLKAGMRPQLTAHRLDFLRAEPLPNGIPPHADRSPRVDEPPTTWISRSRGRQHCIPPICPSRTSLTGLWSSSAFRSFPSLRSASPLCRLVPGTASFPKDAFPFSDDARVAPEENAPRGRSSKKRESVSSSAVCIAPRFQRLA